MKKIFVFALILILMGPTVVMACSCCPSDTTTENNVPVFKSVDCCCGLPTVEKEQPRTDQIDKASLLPASNLNLQFSVGLKSVEGEGSISHVLTLEGLGPPSFLPETPLYLSLLNLRI